MDDELHITLKDFKRALRRMKDSLTGESNVIETVSLNGEKLPVKDKAVNITLPVATTDKAGVIKVGGGINVTEDGTASVDLSTLRPEDVETIATKLVPDAEDVDAMLNEEFQPYAPEA